VRAHKGYQRRWEHAISDLNILIASRGGGFSKGQRNNGAKWLALFLRYAKTPVDKVRAEVYQYAAKCRPPLTKAEVEHAIDSAYKFTAYRVRNATVARELCILPGEAALLDKLKAAEYYDAPPPPKEANQKKLREERRAAILDIIEKAGAVVPTIRELQTLLAKGYGIEPSLQTLHSDLAALGKKNPRAKAARNKTAALFS
jgi:hypothetical protein